MNDPYETGSLITDPATVSWWRRYERESKRAMIQYERWPSCLGHGAMSACCRCSCGCCRRTTSQSGLCKPCMKAGAT